MVLVAAAIVAVLAGTLQLALRHADALREPVTAWLTSTLGQEVELAALEIRLQGLGARLTLHGLRVKGDSDGPGQLQVATLALRLGGPASLLALAPRITELSLRGAELPLVRDSQGRFQLGGLGHIVDQGLGVRTAFLRRGRLTITDSSLTWQDRPNAPSRRLTLRRLELVNRGADHRLSLAGQLHMPGVRTETGLGLAADLRGASPDPSRWRGDFQLGVTGLDLAASIGDPIPEPLAGVEATLTAAGAGIWTGEAISAFRGGILAQDIIHPHSDAKIERLAGDLRWQSLRNGWQVGIRNLALEQNRQTWRGQAIDLELLTWADERRLKGSLDQVELPLLDRLLATLIPAPKPGLGADLADAELQGRIEAMTFGLQLAEDTRAAPTDWYLAGRVRGLGTSPAGAIPGIRGLHAQISANRTSGRLTIGGRDLRLSAPEQFRSPLPLRSLAGELHWRRDPAQGLVLELPWLRVETPHIKTLSELRLAFPDDGRDPQLRARTHLRDAEIAAIGHYLPVGSLDPRLVRWLDRALVRGRIPTGELRFDGPVTAFADRQAKGYFEALLQVSDLELSYHRDWPALERAQGWLRFVDRRLDAVLNEAQVLETRIGPAQARVPDMAHPVGRVLVAGQGRGPFADALQLVSETPMSERVGPLPERFTATGDLALDLALCVPLKQGMAPTLQGEASWPGGDARLDLTGTPVSFEALTGRVGLTTDGLTAEAVKARLWDDPVTLQIDRLGDGDEGPATRARLTGSTRVAELARHFPSPLWDALRGTLPWRIALTMGNADEGPGAMPWRFSSDLVGTDLDLPPPLAKTAATPRSLELTGTLAFDARDQAVEGRLGELAVALALAPAAGKGLGITRGSAAFAAPVPPLPNGRGWAVTASFDELDLADWLAWLETRGDRWQENQLSLRSAALDVRRLSWHGQPLGEARLRASSASQGLSLERLSLAGPLAEVVGSGRWSRASGAGTAESSELTLRGEAPDLGKLLAAFGHPDVVDQAPTSADLVLRWPASPGAVSPASIEGRLSFEIGTGRLLEVEPGVGRVLGILNVGALQRRLTLDFSDLYGKGFGFGGIQGALRIDDGLARIEQLEIAGPSGDIAIAGHMDLVTEELEQVVTVTPKVSSGVALASALAGGPLVGAAVYVADQVAGGAVDRLSQYQYRITGPWTKPVLTPAGRTAALLAAMQPPRENGAKEDSEPSDGGRAQPASDGEQQPRENLFLDLP